MHLKTEPENASLREILDRILDKGIVLNPSDRVVLSGLKLRKKGSRIVVAPERRRKPFVVPKQN
ncbi:MAG TPA: hypothetical protein VI685_19640 [Candidatus Angelobacter sp.]